MMRRNLARALAVLALLAAALAVVLVVTGASDSGTSKTTSTQRAKSKATKTRAAKTKAKPTKARFYVVKPGDTLTKIANRTHIHVDVIQELNPNLDPTSLQTGQKIKLKS